jgi:hypothetical protein
MYSALLGLDLSSFFSDLIRGRQGQTPRWLYLLVAIMIIGLGLNFASSVMTMMTLGNLKYQFGSKGEKILFSPDSRKKMDIIEGFFVTSVVLITVVSFRIYFSPTEMVSNVSQWINENISEMVLNGGHLLMCLVALGLGFTIKGHFLKDIDDNHNKTADELKKIFSVYEDHKPFIANFNALFFILMALLIMTILPSFAGFFGIESMRNFYVNSSASIYTILALIFTVLGFSITGELDKRKDSQYTDFIALAYSTLSLFLVGVVGNILNSSELFKFESLGFIRRIPGVWINIFLVVVAITMFGGALGLGDKIDKIGTSANDIANTTNVYYKVLLSLMVILPGITFLFLLFTYMETSSEKHVFTRIWDAFTNLNNTFILNTIEAFSIIKTFLLMMVVVFAGLTINQYDKIKDTVDKDDYKKYRMKEVFGSFISFLMIVVAVSLFDLRSINGIMTVLIDYIAPLAILILAALLVVYTNEISLLSKKVPIAEIKIDPEEETKKYVAKMPTDVANANTYDGSDKPKI